MWRKWILRFAVAASLLIALQLSRNHPALPRVELLFLHLFFLADLFTRPPVVGRERDTPTRVVMSKVYMALMVYLPVLFPPPADLPAYVATVGVSLTVLGASLALWSRVALGRMGTEMLTIIRDHRLYTRGPYRVIRHPIYCGFLLAFLGHQVAFGSLSGLAIWVLFLIHIIHRRIRLEEEILVQHFSDRYRTYARTTWRMFPCLY